jgi:hypothetical protein
MVARCITIQAILRHTNYFQEKISEIKRANCTANLPSIRQRHYQLGFTDRLFSFIILKNEKKLKPKNKTASKRAYKHYSKYKKIVLFHFNTKNKKRKCMRFAYIKELFL